MAINITEDQIIEIVEAKSTLALLEYRRRFGGIDANYDAAVVVVLSARGWA